MCVECSSSGSTLMMGIGGGSIMYCKSALIHWPFFMTDVLVSIDGVAYVTQSNVRISYAGFSNRTEVDLIKN